MAIPENAEKRYYDSNKREKPINSRWWEFDESAKHDAAGSAWSYAMRLRNDDKPRLERYLTRVRLYSNEEFLAMNPTDYNKVARAQRSDNSRVKLNVIKMVVDTAQAIVAKNRPKPMFLTKNGNYPQQRKAKQLTQYHEGFFDTNKVYQLGQDVVKSAEIFGTGVIKTHGDEAAKRVKIERAFAHELFVDSADAYYGNPRTLYQIRTVSKDWLLARFGDDKEAVQKIRTARAVDPKTLVMMPAEGDSIEIVEAWHLRSAHDMHDGKHIIAIENFALTYDEWDRNTFPFRFLHWNRPIQGFWGNGLVQDLQGIQIEVNKLLMSMQEVHHRICVPRVWINALSPEGSITNEIGGIHRYDGDKPIFETADGLPPEVYRHLAFLIEQGFRAAGVSELSATSSKPAGLDSGEAIKTYNDIETKRFIIFAQDLEEFYMSIAELVTEESKALFKTTKSLPMNVKRKGFIESIDWKDVYIEEDECVLDTFPVSLLPSSPEGQLDYIERMIDKGMLDTRYAMSLMHFPDVEGLVSLETASLDCIRMMIERIVDKGEFSDPEPLLDLSLARREALNAYLRYRTEGLEEERLEMLRQFYTRCSQLLLEAEPPPSPALPPTAPPTEIVPGAPAGALPVIPNPAPQAI